MVVDCLLITQLHSLVQKLVAFSSINFVILWSVHEYRIRILWYGTPAYTLLYVWRIHLSICEQNLGILRVSPRLISLLLSIHSSSIDPSYLQVLDKTFRLQHLRFITYVTIISGERQSFSSLSQSWWCNIQSRQRIMYSSRKEELVAWWNYIH